MTYLRPSSWWSKIFKWFGRYQSVSYDEQYIYYGVRLFDFKLYTDKHYHIIIKNGSFRYNLFSFYDILKFFNDREDVTLRITLDTSLNEKLNASEYNKVERRFGEMCKVIENIYPNIRYIGGYRKYDKKVLYNFEWEQMYGTPTIIDGTSNSLIYRLFPILATYSNRKKIRKYKNKDCFLLLNFVDRK
jgi:hypothetical protein